MTFDHGADAEPVRLADIETERRLIAAVLAENGIFGRISLQADDFDDPSHRELWTAMREIIDRGEAASVAVLALTVPRLQRYIAKLPDVAAYPDAAEIYAGTVRDLAGRRRLFDLGMKLQDQAGDMAKPAQEIASGAIGMLSKIELGRQAISKRRVAEEVYSSLDRNLDMFSTGIGPLDNAMGGGLVSGWLYGFGARKKVGKTILLGTLSHNLNTAGITHLFITLEMSAIEIERRNIGREMGFNSVRFLRSDRSDLRSRVGQYVATVQNCTMYEHAPGATFADLRSIIARARLKGIKGVILDYLQLVEGKQKGETEEYHHRRVAQWLANVARDTGMWIATAAQLNQDDNTRGGEGLKLACDQYFMLNRPKDQPGAWLEMQESRHTLYANVGSESMPGIWLRKSGPHFSDQPPGANEWPASTGVAA